MNPTQAYWAAIENNRIIDSAPLLSELIPVDRDTLDALNEERFAFEKRLAIVPFAANYATMGVVTNPEVQRIAVELETTHETEYRGFTVSNERYGYSYHHDNYDGAPDSTTRNLAGERDTIESIVDTIDEIIDDAETPTWDKV